MKCAYCKKIIEKLLNEYMHEGYINSLEMEKLKNENICYCYMKNTVFTFDEVMGLHNENILLKNKIKKLQGNKEGV